jgi:hypothetical protein
VVILKFTGLSDSPQPARPPGIQSTSPVNTKSGVLNVNVSTTGLDEDLSLVFAAPYVLNASQRALSGNVDNIYQLNRSLIASGGANLGSMVITITITNASTTPAEVVDARIIDRQWHSPWSGTLIYLPPQGVDFPGRMGFNLDRITPVAEKINGLTGEGPFFDNYDIQLPPGVPTTIIVLATTAHHAVSFRVAFDYIIEGKALTLVVGRGPKPFLVSTVDCANSHGFPYQRIYSENPMRGVLQPMSPRELAVYQSASRSTICAAPRALRG